MRIAGPMVVLLGALIGACGADDGADDARVEVRLDAEPEAALDTRADGEPDSDTLEPVEVDVQAHDDADAITDPAEVDAHDAAPDALDDGDGADSADVPAGPVVRGRVLFERRQPDATLTLLGPIEVVPLVGREVIVTAGGVELGRAVTDAGGAFEVPLGELPDAPDTPIDAFVAAVSLALDPVTGAPELAILDADGVAWPTLYGVTIVTTRIWSWIWSAQGQGLAAGDLGAQVISEADGSGALALLEAFEHARGRMADAFGASPEELATLGIIWSPSRTPPCLSCYLPAGWGPVVLQTAAGDVAFERGFLVSGAAASPHHWTPSLIAHELGHHVLETFSRTPAANGAHSWTTRLWPPLAWSEGFATFFGQWSLSSPGHAVSRFFTVQSNVEYWVDIEAIGTTPTGDDTSLSAIFPLPNATGSEDQNIGEAIVAAVLWDLYDDGAGDESLTLGDATLLAIAEPRLATSHIDRGSGGPDLLDYLDALACGGYAPAEALAARLFGLPWDPTPQCLP